MRSQEGEGISTELAFWRKTARRERHHLRFCGVSAKNDSFKIILQVTNYFIFSLAVADFLVALLVMPFAVYVEVRRECGVVVVVGVDGG